MSLVLEQGKKYRVAAVPPGGELFGVRIGDEFTVGKAAYGETYGADGFICDGPSSWHSVYGVGKLWFPAIMHKPGSEARIEEVTTPAPTDRLCTLINELYVAKTRKNEAALEGLVELNDILSAGDHTFTHVSIPDATWVSLPTPVRNAMMLSLSLTAVDTIRGEMS